MPRGSASRRQGHSPTTTMRLSAVQVWKDVRKLPLGASRCLVPTAATFDEGACIAWLLEMPLANHGFKVLDVKLKGSSAMRHGLNNETFIGTGQHCDAYTLHVGDAKELAMVVKHNRDKAKAGAGNRPSSQRCNTCVEDCFARTKEVVTLDFRCFPSYFAG